MRAAKLILIDLLVCPVCLVCLVVWSGGVAFGQEREPLTLPLAVEVALRSHPLMRVVGAGREMAEAQVQEARGARWPMVQLSETVMNGNNPVFVFGSLLEQARFTERNLFLPRLNNPAGLTNFRFGVAIRAPLFDQFQATTRIRQARIRTVQADERTEMVRQQIRFEVVRGYYGLVLATVRKRVADESVGLAAADVKVSRDRVEAGMAVVSDLLAAEVQLAEMVQQQVEAAGELVTARAGLNTALGIAIDTPQGVVGELVGKRFEPGEEAQLLREALEHRPDLRQAGLAVESGVAGVKGARSEYLPRVDLFANFGASRSNWMNGSSDYTVGASLTFNLVDAGRNGRIAQARAANGMMVAEQENLLNQVRFEVVRARQQYLTARERTEVAERMIRQATEAVRIVQDRYREGLTTMTEVLRAQTTLSRARMMVLAARYDCYIGYAQLLLTTGRLTDVQPFVS
jgi:outer membrane protein TolC